MTNDITHYKNSIDKIQTLEYSDEDVIKIAKVLNTQCSEIINAMRTTSTWLYRGITGTTFKMFTGTIRQDRMARNSSDLGDYLANKILQTVGFNTTLRNNSLFCTANSGQAIEYGEPYLIFPENGFHCLYSDNHRDGIAWVDTIDRRLDFSAYLNIEEMLKQIITNIIKEMFRDAESKNANFSKVLESMTKRYTIRMHTVLSDKNLVNFALLILSDNEFQSFFKKNDIIEFKKYIPFDKFSDIVVCYNIEMILTYWFKGQQDKLPSEILSKLDANLLNSVVNPSVETAKDYIKRTGLVFNDIESSLNSHNEIMIGNCKYYALDSKTFQSRLKPLLNL